MIGLWHHLTRHGLLYVLFVAVGVVYWPSLWHMPRGDQLFYLAEVAYQKDWFTLALGGYDLNRTRLWGPGDEILFRPLLYLILGTQKFFFGYNFICWQLTGLLAHLTVVALFYRLLASIRPAGGALLWTAFFALSFMNMELVVWHHLTAYLVFVALMLGALYHLHQLVSVKGDLLQELRPLVVMMTLACFIYELGNAYALLMAVVLWKYRRDAGCYLIWLILPVIAYVCMSLTNLLLIHHLQLPSAGGMSFEKFFIAVKGSFITMFWWMYTVIFYEQYPVILTYARAVFEGKDVLVFKWPSLMSAASCAAVVAVVCYAGLLRRSFKNGLSASSRALIVTLSGMIVLYVLVIALGRGEVKGYQETLRLNLYYIYMFCAWLIIGLYILIDRSDDKAGKYRVLLVKIGAGALMLMIFVNAFKVYETNLAWKRHWRSSVGLISHLERLIKENNKDPQFSFYVDPSVPGNYTFPEIKKKTDPADKTYSLTELLYPQYVKPLEQAKYRFLLAS